jgi:hypothetical protein
MINFEHTIILDDEGDDLKIMEDDGDRYNYDKNRHLCTQYDWKIEADVKEELWDHRHIDEGDDDVQIIEDADEYNHHYHSNSRNNGNSYNWKVKAEVNEKQYVTRVYHDQDDDDVSEIMETNNTSKRGMTRITYEWQHDAETYESSLEGMLIYFAHFNPPCILLYRAFTVKSNTCDITKVASLFLQTFTIGCYLIRGKV